MTKLTVFYSWQSDLPKATNLTVIRSALRIASNGAESENPDLKVDIDESARGVTGSPEITSEILKKIRSCDVFACDVTTINSGDPSRPVPNPNVMLELGYAIAHVGWDRIIMLFNEAYGKIVTDVPFDLEKRRIAKYSLKDKKTKGAENELGNRLAEALKEIIAKNPAKPSVTFIHNPEAIKRANDIKNIKRALSTIHIPTMDYFIEQLPDRIIGKIMPFWHSFEGIINSSTFFLHDKIVLDHFKQLQVAWGTVLSYPEWTSSNNSDNLVFDMPGDMLTSERAQKDYKEASKMRSVINESYTKLLNHVRENYLEIDVNALSEEANKLYLDWIDEPPFKK